VPQRKPSKSHDVSGHPGDVDSPAWRAQDGHLALRDNLSKKSAALPADLYTEPPDRRSYAETMACLFDPERLDALARKGVG
jgi:hypothetical protein